MFDIAKNIHKAKNTKRIIRFVLIKTKGSWKWLNVERKEKVRKKLKKEEEEEDKLDLF